MHNNFSLINTLKKDDPRIEKYRNQQLERGFDDSELWSLDDTVLQFLLPRLRIFKTYTKSYPADLKSLDEWQNIIQKMIDEIENYKVENDNNLDTLFKYFMHLWD